MFYIAIFHRIHKKTKETKVSNTASTTNTRLEQPANASTYGGASLPVRYLSAAELFVPLGRKDGDQVRLEAALRWRCCGCCDAGDKKKWMSGGGFSSAAGSPTP